MPQKIGRRTGLILIRLIQASLVKDVILQIYFLNRLFMLILAKFAQGARCLVKKL